MTIIRTDKPLQPRRKNEFYETPEPLVRAALDLLPNLRYKTILDPGAGNGVWGRVARANWPSAEITGIDLHNARRGSPYNIWKIGNYALYESASLDLIIGNPPYGDAWEEEQKRKRATAKHKGQPYHKPKRPARVGPFADAEVFVRHSLHLLKPKGYLVFLLRLAFLESQKRGNGLWDEFPPQAVHVLVERPSFTGNGKTDETAYAIYIWRKDWTGDTRLEWLSWR